METAKEYYMETRSVDTNIWTLELSMNFADEYADQFKQQLKEKEIENEKLKNQLRLIDEFFSTMFHPNNINNPNARF